jgi:ubiquinone/menaquinone biosynthesis C-methylase UbiE
LRKFHPEAICGLGARFYRAASGTRIFQRHYELIAQDILRYCPQGCLLDIGTGPGRLLLQLHQVVPGLCLTGVDVSPSMVVQARKILAQAGLSEVIDVREGQAGQLPFGEESFDVVVSTGSLHHWKDPVAGLNEVYRVLRPGGYALIYDLVTDPPASVWKETIREFGRWRVLLLWIHAFEEPFYSCRGFAELAGATRFRPEPLRFVDVMACLALKKEL